MHSEMQDVILNEMSERFDFENNLTYDLMKKLAIPVWLKDTNKLRNLVLTVAKVEYKIAGDDFNKTSRAEKTALWYLLLDKKDMLVKLYKQEVTYKKLYELLLNDFTLPKYKTAAEKNALVLMGKKNYFFCCAFFILGGNLRDAVKIALDKMADPILAVLMARLFEKETFDAQGKPKDTLLSQIYLDQFLTRGESLLDPYLQNMGRWLRKEYLKAVNVFAVDPGRQSNIQHLLVNNTDFNILHTKLQPVKQ